MTLVAAMFVPSANEWLEARKLSLVGAVLLLTSPGVPMLFEGQETLATGTFLDPPTPLPTPTAQGLQIRAAVVNMMNKAYTEYDVGVDTAGPWTVRFNSESTAYSSDFGAGQIGSITACAGQKDGKAYTLPLQLAAYSAMILTP